MRSILKVKHRVAFLQVFLPRSQLKRKQQTRAPFTFAPEVLKTINLDKKCFDILINVKYRLQAFRKSLIE